MEVDASRTPPPHLEYEPPATTTTDEAPRLEATSATQEETDLVQFSDNEDSLDKEMDCLIASDRDGTEEVNRLLRR